jgi:rod shape determining protein RodA
MADGSFHDSDEDSLSVPEKLVRLNWGLVLLIAIIGGIGLAMLYSGANGSWQPWAGKQAIRFGVAGCIMIGAALVDIRTWARMAYPFYVAILVLLVGVGLRGAVGMGAQRWIDLGVIQLQPSELMKIALILALARYFHAMDMARLGRPWRLIVPAALVMVPAALVLKQPDLGTALMLVLGGIAMFFLAGVRWWMFILVGAAGGGAVPLIWRHLRDYQKARITTFLNPDSDPLGAGYHSLQSRIAIGSGGEFGKGFMQGTQAHLNFLPEKQTDFIFTMFAEEFGLVGGITLLAIYLLVFVYGFAIAFASRSYFGRLLALGITVNFALYVFINMAMVMGLIPVVGVPLPLVSYGGTAMLTIMFGFGLMLSVYIHRDTKFGRGADADD